MRFMIIIKANADSEAGTAPSKELIEAMGRYNEELVKAGVMVAGEGLHPSSKGARVTFSRGKAPAVVDGPFAESKELIAGFWMFQTKSKEEAIEWVKRIPDDPNSSEDWTVEIRQVFETEEFSPEVMSPEEAAREHALRDELARRQSAS
ncbi:YciI family protein [Nannocystis sp. SCPEA4]|uniref:YciI family protein n=1 Tax=Nannocystis sp. SCPEA4 TaxID=2996787 RepID=UPI002272168B|nr:YciI family protein [Nannocystis sp. SCPEA4]MCY1060905.1 YciI family protein [Nannocystis sp. SCPEA4]